MVSKINLKFKKMYGHFKSKLGNKFQSSLTERNLTVNLTSFIFFIRKIPEQSFLREKINSMMENGSLQMQEQVNASPQWL